MADPTHRILTAELLSIGSELTTGETRDTNSGELARALTEAGVRVLRITALPDELEAVRAAFASGMERADLVVSTGGLGPTPDDLTREAIAAALDETPAVDAGIEAWLRELWARRRIPFPEVNLKQAWLIPSAEALPNENGTAPGWFVRGPGAFVVALPGPPREMRPIWAEALARLGRVGLGVEAAVRTYRLAGIGESQVADLLGEALLRATNPIVATYARADAVDVRISAVPEPEGHDGHPGRPAEELVDEAEAIVLAHLGKYVWGRGAESWPEAIGKRLDHLDWTLATSEAGTGGTLTTLFGGSPWLVLSESLAVAPSGAGAEELLATTARVVRERSGAAVGLAVAIEPDGKDTLVRLAIATPNGVHPARHRVFLGGPMGRSRAALTAAAELLARLRVEAQEEDLAR